MHNPRGSNDRNCERNDNRNNANRLFDSQNNAAGGYACPRAVGGPETETKRMYYYVGSKLKIEWTSQHSCGNPNNNCDVIFQYSCVEQMPGLRDGTPTNQNDDATDSLTAQNKDDARQGSHEPYDYYQKCSTRLRNRGLYIADRNINMQGSATQTRQNENGNKHGWECPEERDYYPYWHWSPWKDIAVLTNNVSRCDYYREQSQNVKSRNECWSADGTTYLKWNNENDCLVGNGVWKEVAPWNIDRPDCRQNEYQRDNHLGNTRTGESSNYWWTIPNDVSQGCVLRVRYNISTGDFPWETDYTMNGGASPIKQDPINSDGGYVHPLQFAVNTNQYGRTFQDRSYVFEIKKRPDNVSPWTTIWNLNVRGKRGNIVETYPSVEYDFVPQVLDINGGDMIHFQWTGSDYNPNRTPNDAEGGPPDKANSNAFRADRNNIVQASTSDVNLPRKATQVSMFLNPQGAPDLDLINKLALLDQPGLTSTVAGVKCLTYDELLKKNNNNNDDAQRDIQNCMKLNNAPTPYFDGGLVTMRASGRFAYLSSRNNNFSNRSQKGLIIVSGAQFNSAIKSVLNISMLIVMFFFALF